MQIGTVVERVQGKPQDVGRTGVIVQVMGSISGDTLVAVRGTDGTKWECYTRQLKVASR